MKVWSNLYKHGEGSEKLEKVLFYLELSGEEAGKSNQPCLAAHSHLEEGAIKYRSKTDMTRTLGKQRGKTDMVMFAPEL